MLSDSGTITEESSILNFPALNLRDVHERPEGFEEAAVMLVGLERRSHAARVDIFATQPRGDQRALRIVETIRPQCLGQGSANRAELYRLCEPQGLAKA